ncbi:hypothetical protein [Thiocystis violacea]|uniref:hypothetical protein n=1 Tax=Thiocystis violacea TaxID=13725 RepID=UPI0019038BB2|nr:hypothetical protein [Thiocystis violacea]MBK1718371.1 hypothetical protein [Thiocystis violacea]
MPTTFRLWLPAVLTLAAATWMFWPIEGERSPSSQPATHGTSTPPESRSETVARPPRTAPTERAPKSDTLVRATPASRGREVRPEPEVTEIPESFPLDEWAWRDAEADEAGLEPFLEDPTALSAEPSADPWGGAWTDQGGQP